MANHPPNQRDVLYGTLIIVGTIACAAVASQMPGIFAFGLGVAYLLCLVFIGMLWAAYDMRNK